MNFSIASATAPTIGPPESGKPTLNRWTLAIVVIGLLVVGVLFSLIYFSTSQVSSETFSYSPPRDPEGSYNSLAISDLDGLVVVRPWSQPTILINGTITAKGLGSSLSAIILSNSSSNGNVILKANFPIGGGILFSQIYTANITVFVPSTVQFSSVQISNVNGGVRLDGANSTSVSVITVNGDIFVGCTYCMNTTVMSTNGNVAGTFTTLVSKGSYNLTATNANIDFTAPSSSSFTLSARVLNGYITCLIPNCVSNSKASLTQTFGTGDARVNLDSVNGQITITGT